MDRVMNPNINIPSIAFGEDKKVLAGKTLESYVDSCRKS